MKKRNFSAEFKCESAQLVVDQSYTVTDVGLSTMTRWANNCVMCAREKYQTPPR